MGACRIVTISKKIPLFKGEDAANNITLVELAEVGNRIVTGINTFKEGDQGLFIEPDYCLPNSNLFSEFHSPGGDPKKSKLGKDGRIKAVKFNLHTGDGKPVYSYGILMPLNGDIIKELMYRNIDITSEDLDKQLGITKYSPKTFSNNLEGSRKFPEGMYKTDEININNLWNDIEYPITLIGTQKVDGSSITIYSKLNADGTRTNGICSRNLEISPTKMVIIGDRKMTLWETIKTWFGKRVDTKVWKEQPNDNLFIKVGTPYLNKLIETCEIYGESIALRGELVGKESKGSGNKNNPNSTEDTHIKFYGADIFEGDIAIRMDEEGFNDIISRLGFERCHKYFQRKFRYKSEIVRLCENIFKEESSKGRVIEGIVLRSPDSSFSAKYINLEYDSKY